MPTFDNPGKENGGKGENADNQHFLLLLFFFNNNVSSIVNKTRSSVLDSHLFVVYANTCTFNLDQSIYYRRFKNFDLTT